MLEPAGPATALPRAFLHVGGLTVARQQLGVALALGCDRIVCLVRALDPEVLALQHATEEAGAQFHAIAAPRALSGLVTAADELVVLADGLLADPGEAARLLDAGPGVLVQPVEVGVAAGFERIDLNTASAGAMRLPGRLVERLTELSDDADAVSALTRIALQGGVPQRHLPAGEVESRNWAIVRSDDEGHGLEPAWLARRMKEPERQTPGRMLSRWIARKYGPALLHAGSGKRSLAGGAAALALFGLVAGWFGFVATGLALCGIGWVVSKTLKELVQVERRALLLPLPRFSATSLFGAGVDVELIVLAGWGLGAPAGQYYWLSFFAPAMVVALTRLLPRAVGRGWASWFEDRLVLALLLAAAQISGYADFAHHAAAALIALLGIAMPRGNRG